MNSSLISFMYVYHRGNMPGGSVYHSGGSVYQLDLLASSVYLILINAKVDLLDSSMYLILIHIKARCH